MKVSTNKNRTGLQRRPQRICVYVLLVICIAAITAACYTPGWLVTEWWEDDYTYFVISTSNDLRHRMEQIELLSAEANDDPPLLEDEYWLRRANFELSFMRSEQAKILHYAERDVPERFTEVHISFRSAALSSQEVINEFSQLINSEDLSKQDALVAAIYETNRRLDLTANMIDEIPPAYTLR